MYAITTDTSANLSCELARAKDIVVIPFTYIVDGVENTCTDTEGFDGAAYYSAMRAGAKVMTSQVTPQRYIDYWTPILESGRDVLFIGMSSGISGSFSSAGIAAAQLSEKFPKRHIRLVDTLGASLGEGLLVLRAVENREKGMSLSENAREIAALRDCVCQIFTVEDLKYLHNTGRVSNVAALVGTVLNLKPLLYGNDEGKIVSFDKVRGRKKSVLALAEHYNRLVAQPEDQIVGISHADCEPDALLLAELLRKNHPPKEIMIVQHEPATGSHVGPGMLGLFFFGDSDVRGKL